MTDPLNRAEVYTDREDWLSGRRSTAHGPSLSVSDIASILLGKDHDDPRDNAFEDAWSVWARLHAPDIYAAQRAKQELLSGDDLDRGNDAEEFILGQYAKRRKVALHWPWESRWVIFDGEPCGAPWLRGSPDHFATADALRGVEAKSDRWGDHAFAAGQDTVIEKWSPAASRLVPLRVALQVYGYMAITGIDSWDIVAAIPSRPKWLEYRIVRVERDDSIQQRILDKINDWREVHLIGGEPPPFTSSKMCRAWSQRKSVAPQKTVEIATEREARLIRKLHEARKMKRQAEREAAAAANELAALVGEDYGRRISSRPSGPKATLPEVGRESLSIERLREAEPETYNRLKAAGVITHSTHRQVRVTGF